MQANPSFKKRIIHIDMDAFFASVEQRDFPELKGKPVAVGGGKRGVVAAASYEARKFGVHSAMPSVIAAKKCHDLIFMPPRFHVYKEVSQIVMDIFRKYTPLVEPLSLDEAFLDISDNLLGYKTAKETAIAIKKDILEATGLTASAGVSFNKFLAKTASGFKKPNGLTVIAPKSALAFMAKLPIKAFHGVGEKTAIKMKKLGIYTGKDLMNKSENFLTQNFGKSGSHYFNIINLQDHRAVKPNRERKSVGVERTFENDIDSPGLMYLKINQLADKLNVYIKKKNTKGKTITLKIKYNNFQQITRSKTLPHFTNSIDEIKETTKKLLKENLPEKPVRLLGISLSNFEGLSNENDLKNNNEQLKFEF